MVQWTGEVQLTKEAASVEAQKAAREVRMTTDLRALTEHRDSVVAELVAAQADASAKVELEQRLADREQALQMAEAAAVAARSESETSRAAAERRKETGLRRCVLRNMFRAQALALDGWRDGAQLQRQKRVRLKVVYARMTNFRSARALDTWSEWVSTRAQLRETAIDCMMQMQRVRVSKAMAQWHVLARASRVARLHVSESLQRHAWRSWVDFMARRLDQHTRTARYLAAMRLKYQFAAFHAWNELASLMMRQREFTLAVVDRWIDQQLSGAFRVWCQHIQEQRWRTTIIRRALDHWYFDRLSRGFHGWVLGVARRRRLNVVTGRIKARWCRETWRKCFTRWHRHTVEMSSMRAAHGAIQEAYAAMHASQTVGEEERMAVVDVVLQKCIAKLLRSMMQRAFLTWVHVVQSRKHSRKVAMYTIERWQAQAYRIAFETWRAEVARDKMRQQREMLINMRDDVQHLKTELAKAQTLEFGEYDADQQQRLQDAVAAKRQLEARIQELEKDLSWTGDTSMELSIAHKEDERRLADITKQKEHLEREVASLRAHSQSLQKDLATAGLLAAQLLAEGDSGDGDLAGRLHALQQAYEKLLIEKEKIEQQLAGSSDDKDQELVSLKHELDRVLSESASLREAHAAEVSLLRSQIENLQEQHRNELQALLAKIADLEEVQQQTLLALAETEAKLVQEQQARAEAEEAFAAAVAKHSEEVDALQQQHAEVVADVKRALMDIDDDMAKVVGEDLEDQVASALYAVEQTATLLEGDRKHAHALLEESETYLVTQLAQLKARQAREVEAAIRAAQGGVGVGGDASPLSIEELRALHEEQLLQLQSQNVQLLADKARDLEAVEALAAGKAASASRLSEAQRLKETVESRLQALENQQALELQSLEQAHGELLQNKLQGAMERHALELRLSELGHRAHHTDDTESKTTSAMEHLRAQHSEELARAQEAYDNLRQQKQKLEQQLSAASAVKDQEVAGVRQELDRVLSESASLKEVHTEVKARHKQEIQALQGRHAREDPTTTEAVQPSPRGAVAAVAEEQQQALQNLYTQQMEAASKANAEVVAVREELTSILADMDRVHEEHDSEIEGLHNQLAAAEEQFAAEVAQRENLEVRLAAAVQERAEQRAILDATQAKLRAAEAERDEALSKVAELEALLASSGQEAVQLQEALDAADFKLVQLAAFANASQNAPAAPQEQQLRSGDAGTASTPPSELRALEEADMVMQERADLEAELAAVQAKVASLEAELTVATDGVQRVSPSVCRAALSLSTGFPQIVLRVH